MKRSSREKKNTLGHGELECSIYALPKKKCQTLQKKRKIQSFLFDIWCLVFLEHVFCAPIPFRWIIGFSSVWKLLFDAIFAHTHTVPSKPLIEQDTFTLNPKINCYFPISLSSIGLCCSLVHFCRLQFYFWRLHSIFKKKK